VRREPTVIKAALAGVMLETSFARFRTSMATFSEERTPFRPFGRWNSAAMVESYEKTVWCVGCEEEPGP